MDSPARTTTANGTVYATETTLVAPRLGLSSQPAYATLLQLPVACFFGTLLTDLAYWKTVNFIWETFSIWLLTAGCIFGGIAAIAGLITWIAHRHVRKVRYAGAYVFACLAAFILSIINAFIHSRDGYAAVVPSGLTLSAIVVILMLVATWLGWPRVQYVQPVTKAGVL